jgi:glycosyltransferase involved in cell wall biosynthesis
MTSAPRTSSRKLAIALPLWGEVTQTFVRQHVLHLAPNDTALITFAGDEKIADFPVLRIERSGFGSAPGLANKVRRYISLITRGTTTPIKPGDRRRLLQFLRELNVSTVLAEFGSVGSWLASVRMPRAIRVFVHFHGYDASGELQYWQSRFSCRRLARRAAGIIVPSQALANELQKIGVEASKIHIIPCGVNVENFSPGDWQEKSGPLLAVGRLVEKKAPMLTIEAFADVARQHDDARLMIIGDGHLLADCEAKIRELGLVGKVELCGARDHSAVKAAMRSACMFVQHSVTAADGDMEGLPVSILEAMSSGLPVVSTRHSGIREAVVEGVTGFLVDEGDVKGMSRALLDLYRDPAKRRAMGAAGRERAHAKYSQEASLRKLREVLQLKAADA